MKTCIGKQNNPFLDPPCCVLVIGVLGVPLQINHESFTKRIQNFFLVRSILQGCQILCGFRRSTDYSVISAVKWL